MNQPKARSVSQLLLTAPFAGLTAAFVLLSGIPAMAAPPTTVYAGGIDGVIRSTDGGLTWTTLLPNVSIAALAIDPLNPEVIYAVETTAVYKTVNGGTNWTKETSGLTSPILTSIAIDPINPNTIYVGAGLFFPGGIFKSTDAGVHWTAINNGLGCFPNEPPPCSLSVRSLAIDPLNHNIIYATGDTGFQSAKSTNGGASWSSLLNAPGFGFVIAVNPVQDSTVFIDGPFGLYESSNAGSTWGNTPLSSLSFFSQSMALDPTNAATMYIGLGDCVGCASTVYRSTDTGAQFTAVGALSTTPGAEGVRALTVDPADPTTLYAAGVTGVWQSANSGTTWKLVDATHELSAVVMAPNALQAGTFDVFETAAQAAIAVAEDFKGNPTIACGILKDSLLPIPGLVQFGLLSSTQGQALTLQIQTAETSIPCSN